MGIQGLRVHIAGSAAIDADGELLEHSHEVVRKVASRVINAGAGLVVGAGGEPVGESGLPCIFDWAVLEAIARAADPAPNWPAERRARFVVVTSQRALERIPDRRQSVWDKCRIRSDFDLVTSPPGWQMGGTIRAKQVQMGDVLVAIGGGAGTEQLAELYVDEGKRVVPLHAELGAISGDGNGGSSFLHTRALNDIKPFFDTLPGAGSATAWLSKLKLARSANSETTAADLFYVLDNLTPPTAFYVRLVAPDNDLFQPVEKFFRRVVDPVIVEKGFRRHEVGLDQPLSAFLNVEIFQTLHRAGLVVVDLTAVRPNCLMELGYALGRRRRVVVSAIRGTPLPFDQDKLPTYLWEDKGKMAARLATFREWFEGHIDMPPLVS